MNVCVGTNNMSTVILAGGGLSIIPLGKLLKSI